MEKEAERKQVEPGGVMGGREVRGGEAGVCHHLMLSH